MSTGNLTHSPVNDTRYQDLLAKSAEFGALAGQGVDVQVKHGLSVFQAAFDAVIDNTSDKHGKGIDDATMLAEAYWKARNQNVKFDPRAPNQRKTVSCLRTVISGGGWNHGGPQEPLGMVNKAMTIYQQLRRDPATSKRLIDAMNYLVLLCRKLKTRHEVLDEEELRALAFKKDASVPTVNDVLDHVRHTLVALKNGKHRAGVCTGVNIEAAIKALSKELKDSVTVAPPKTDVSQASASAENPPAGVDNAQPSG